MDADESDLNDGARKLSFDLRLLEGAYGLPEHRLGSFVRVLPSGAFHTADGSNWVRLLDTAALSGRPVNCYFDSISKPAEPALYVAFDGRSVVKVTDL